MRYLLRGNVLSLLDLLRGRVLAELIVLERGGREPRAEGSQANGESDGGQMTHS